MSTVNDAVNLPNQYHLHGNGISVSYFPQGSGPLIEGQGAVYFTYHDAHRSLTFREDAVRTAEVPDLGRIVSASIVETVDTGSTTVSLLVPNVMLPSAREASVQVHTDLITTLHLVFVAAIGHPQHEMYTVTPLSGVASAGMLPQ